MRSIEILVDKKSWIAVNKPSGLSVHNDEDETNLQKELTKQGLAGFSPVNRLDKETSGIMLLSSDSDTSAKLQAVLSASETKKTYLAVVKGAFPPGKDCGRWSQDLTNKAEGRKNPAGIKASRVKCVTNYKVLKDNKYLSLLELQIDSGRQHQIRKHCVLNKHQIVGDNRYGDAKYGKLIKSKYSFNEMALHSHKLEFKLSNEEFCIEVTEPKSWNKLLAPIPQ